MVNIKIIGYMAAIVSTTLTGALGVFVRNISANGYIITFSRVGIGLIFLVLFLFLRNELHGIRKIKFSVSILTTGFFLSLVILCYTNAINNTSLANAAFLLYLGPIIAVGVAAITLKEKLTALNGVLLGLAFLGLLFLLEFQFSFNLEESRGYLWAVGSAICYGLFIVSNRKIPQNIPVLIRSFYQFLFAAIIMLPFLDGSLFHLTRSDMYWLIAIGFFQGFLAITLAILSLSYLKAIEYGTISYIEPLVASMIGFVLYSENLTLLQLIGCTIVFSCGMMQVLSTKK